MTFNEIVAILAFVGFIAFMLVLPKITRRLAEKRMKTNCPKLQIGVNVYEAKWSECKRIREFMIQKYKGEIDGYYHNIERTINTYGGDYEGIKEYVEHNINLIKNKRKFLRVIENYNEPFVSEQSEILNLLHELDKTCFKAVLVRSEKYVKGE